MGKFPDWKVKDEGSLARQQQRSNNDFQKIKYLLIIIQCRFFNTDASHGVFRPQRPSYTGVRCFLGIIYKEIVSHFSSQ